MNQLYICKKCNYTFHDDSSDKFIKTVLKKCPVCGSSEVQLSNTRKYTKSKFAKKTNK